jgi:hypothetical protein
MKKQWKDIPALLTVLGLIFALTACGSAPSGNAPSSDAPPSGSPRQTAPAESDAPTESGPPADTETPDGSEEVECSWSLDVDDTISTKVNGYDFQCRLEIHAVKSGGTDDLGTYSGTMSITYEYQMQNGNVSGNASGSGQDANAVLEFTVYDKEQYTDEANTELAPLVEYDAMSFGSFSVTGSGFSEEQAGGGSWSTDDSKTVAVPYQILIDGGQVTVNLPSLVSTPFSGMVTGTPLA